MQLLDPFAGQLEFFVGSSLGFLDKGMNNDDAFTEQEAIEGSLNAGVIGLNELLGAILRTVVPIVVQQYPLAKRREESNIGNVAVS